MWLFAVALPVVFVWFGAYSLYLGVRSWDGQGVRPSRSVLLSAGKSARIRRFTDRCVVPLGLFSISAGVTLGLAGTDAGRIATGTSQALDVALGVSVVASVAFLALTLSVYRYGKPRRLIPAYLRSDVPRRVPTAD